LRKNYLNSLIREQDLILRYVNIKVVIPLS